MKKIKLEELLNEWTELNELIKTCDLKIHSKEQEITQIKNKLKGNYSKYSQYLSQIDESKKQIKTDRYNMIDKTLDYLAVKNPKEKNNLIENMESAKNQYHETLRNKKRIDYLYFENYEQNSNLDTIRCRKQNEILKFKIMKLAMSIRQQIIYKKIINYLGTKQFEEIIKNNSDKPKQKGKK